MIDFHPILPALQTPCRQLGELDFYRFSLDLLPRCVPLTDSCLHSPWFFLSRKHTPCLPLQCKIRRSSRRRSDISTFIQDNIDTMLLTETWLRPAGDEAKIDDLAPPGYSVLSFSRSDGGPAQKAGASPSS